MSTTLASSVSKCVTRPLVSALICTRDRPQAALQAVRSVLASEGVDLDLIVVDQSEGSETAQLLEGLTQRAKLRYIRSETRGVGAALNEGLRLARSPYVLRTDDDCLVPPDWVAGMAAIMEMHPHAALVFCRVLAEPHDRNRGYVPTYEPQLTRVLRSPLAACGGWGLGAGMGFRRDAVLAIGGVDAMMGPGGKFHSADDLDIELRVLLRGWHVVDTAELAVVHRGFRTFAEGRDHAIRDWLGIGACLGKLARARHPSVLVLAAWELWVHAILPPLIDGLHLRKPRGLQRIVSFGRGFAHGLTAPVDVQTLRFTDERELLAGPP